MYDTENEKERVILVAVETNNDEESDVLESVDELRDLIKTAGAIPVGTIIQKRERKSPATYVGKGKVEEIKKLLEENNATGIVCDDELSPAQQKNLQEELQVKVMDRTLVILDIFAQRATTNEGKVQVELAQLKYNYSRLVGLRSALSRLAGGIGTRGPGEKKLEIDRRLISDRITQLKQEIKELAKHREVTRQQRIKSNIPTVAIVGYTNAGKSTLLNHMTNACVIEEDKLFATLDPTTRLYKLQKSEEILLTDTVGFVRKLPHHLIDAFKSTLEEAKYADIIIHVVDASSIQMIPQISIVYETLDKLGVKDKPIITLFNKMDKLQEKLENGQEIPRFIDERADYVINTSIKQDKGIDEVVDTLIKVLREQKILIKNLYDFKEAGKINIIRQQGQLLVEEYRADGIYVEAYVTQEILGKVTKTP